VRFEKRIGGGFMDGGLALARRGDEQVASPRWQEDALGFLMAPVGREAFVATITSSSRSSTSAGEPERYASLLTLAMLDDFVASADLREGMIELTNRKQPGLARRLYP
jgi:hypothetical protein